MRLPYSNLRVWAISQDDEELTEAAVVLADQLKHDGSDYSQAEVKAALWSALCGHLSQFTLSLPDQVGGPQSDLEVRYRDNLRAIHAARQPQEVAA